MILPASDQLDIPLRDTLEAADGREGAAVTNRGIRSRRPPPLKLDDQPEQAADAHRRLEAGVDLRIRKTSPCQSRTEV